MPAFFCPRPGTEAPRCVADVRVLAARETSAPRSPAPEAKRVSKPGSIVMI
jgi:hypothetical protein